MDLVKPILSLYIGNKKIDILETEMTRLYIQDDELVTQDQIRFS